MSEALQTQKQSAVSLMQQDNVKKKFAEILGAKSAGFITSVLSAVNSNALLKNATPNSVYMAAMMAAALDLPVNQNLGFAYIIPYNSKVKGENGEPDTWVTAAQFQMGYKGFIQLAQRSGQYKTISAAPVYEGQLISEDPLKGFEFDWTAKKSDKIIGYAGYFALINGFEKTLYMSVEELQKHGQKYSKTYNQNSSKWKTDFEAMAMKTVIKLLLSKFAPLSVDTVMQKAIVADQAVINDSETLDVTYTDSTEVIEEVKPELTADQLKKQTIIELIKTAESEKEVDKHVKQLSTDKDVLAAALDRKTELEKDVKN
jgi:recombination protein RecT